ncbi:MAG: tetratricopeptide repeat protein [Oscillatoriales cyanobacterium SM2_1_8]|nr:tetratricopeptide repeat protein [Oscillatoriales cyanobacterium SM2_1_8]
MTDWAAAGWRCYDQGDRHGALRCWGQAVQGHPGWGTVWNNLCLVWDEVGEAPRAIAAGEQAVRHLGTAIAWNSLGLAWLHLETWPALGYALGCFAQALALQPDYGKAHLNRGHTLILLGRLGEAKASFERAIARLPQDANAHVSYAQCLLGLGEWDTAWQEYEWRWRLPEAAACPSAAPRWQGEPTDRLLVWGEQGYGDILQFARYQALLPSKHWWLPPALVPLLGGTPDTAPPPVASYQIPLLSVPMALGHPPIPPAPYLPLPSPLPLAGQTKIGVVWATGYREHPDHRRLYRRKSCPLTALAPLWELPYTFYSLQVGADALQGLHPPLQDLAPQLTDFAQTARAIAALDAVVAVDTATAHLAGALGKPLYLLLPYHGDWRWATDDLVRRWYPTALPLRQTAPGDWSEAIARLVRALA